MIISAVNLNKTEELSKANSVNIKSNTDKTEAGEVGKVFENTNISSLEKTSSTKVDSKGLSSLMDDAASATEALKNSAVTAQESLKALFNKMSVSDCVKMDEDGFNLNDMTPDQVVTVVDRIKIMMAAYCDDYQGAGDSIDMAEIKKVLGNTGMVNQVATKLKSADLPDTKDNVEEVNNTSKQAEEIKPLSEQAKTYLVSNNLEPSIQNIYKAEHASTSVAYQSSGYQKAAAAMSDIEWNQLKPQVEEIINKAGLQVNEQNLDNAKSFIENNIPVTEENLVYKNELDHLDLTEMDGQDNKEKVLDKIINNMALGNTAGSTLLTDTKSVQEMVAEAVKTVQAADWKETAYVTNQGESFTIENLSAAQRVMQQVPQSQVQNELSSVIQDQTQNQEQGQIQTQNQELSQTQNQLLSQDAQTITNYRQLEEIRILMTADAGLSLAKQGFNLDTTPIADLVEQLKTMEAQLYGEESSQIIEVKKAVYDIKTAPDVIIGAVLAEQSTNQGLTITDFSQMGSNLKQRFKQAGQTYEAVGTQVRKDLGDSVSKAADASTESILSDLALEDTKANRDAIRILGYNGMEMSLENIRTVKGIYSTLHSVIDNMKPETVLSMIRNNLNPMKSDINDVNEYLIKENENVQSTDKYSQFLYKLERTDGITEQERAQFIGIYKMMNIFKKDAGKAVGTLVKQNEEITMSNLMAAYKSSKAAGMDTSIDDNTGLAEIVGTVNYYNNLFSATADSITPRTLKTVNDEKAINSRSVENFCEAVDEKYDSKLESDYYDKYLKDVNHLTDIEESVVRDLTNNNMQVSMNNLIAMQNIMAPDYFQKYFKLNSKNTTNNELQDSDNSNSLDTLVDKLDSDSDINEAYQKLSEVVETTANDALNSDEDQTYSNIEDLRMMGKEIGIIKDLGKKHNYRIPFVIDGEVGTIHLQVVEDDKNKGRIAVRLETKELGNVSIEGKLSSQNASVFAVTDGDKNILSDRINKVTDEIAADLEVENVSIYAGKSDEIPEVNYKTDSSEITTKKLYQFAKILITGMIKPE